ncbi:hypothetical protein EV651_1196 [Kribbella sp. VKM Ac-2571]|nr:hypothetical protein EV651_1196 [Kribbella sp. VKM Ac-2571]
MPGQAQPVHSRQLTDVSCSGDGVGLARRCSDSGWQTSAQHRGSDRSHTGRLAGAAACDLGFCCSDCRIVHAERARRLLVRGVRSQGKECGEGDPGADYALDTGRFAPARAPQFGVRRGGTGGARRLNTINKWAAGIADNYVLTQLAELTSLDVRIAVLPFVNQTLASNLPFVRSVEALREAGVRVLFGPGEFEPHPPCTGDAALALPLALALRSACG